MWCLKEKLYLHVPVQLVQDLLLLLGAHIHLLQVVPEVDVFVRRQLFPLKVNRGGDRHGVSNRGAYLSLLLLLLF